MCCQIQNALRSFVEVTEHYPDDVRRSAQFDLPLEPTDDTGKTLALRDFVAVGNQYLDRNMVGLRGTVFVCLNFALYIHCVFRGQYCPDP